MPVLQAESLAAAALVRQIKAKAAELGFDLCGIAPADPSRYADYFRQWLAEGRHGEMAYLSKRVDERIDPRRYFPEATSVVCLAVNYYHPLAEVPEAERADHGRVARYALGRDYHEHIKKKLHDLADWLRQAVPGCRTRASTDTAPILEREMAARAGVGWVGKNTCIIHPKVGSFLLLGQVLTTLDLSSEIDRQGAPMPDHCGTCTRCIDACPTAAITGPYQLDASQCISYLTIEHRGEIAEPLKQRIGDWIFGCDVCQDVCPHNRQPPTSTDEALVPRIATGTINAREAAEWTESEYHAATRHSATRRVKLPQFQRNARIVLNNARRGEQT